MNGSQIEMGQRCAYRSKISNDKIETINFYNRKLCANVISEVIEHREFNDSEQSRNGGVLMFEFIKIYRGLPRNVYTLFLIQLINRLGDFVVPFLAMYLIYKLQFDSKTASILVTCVVLLQVPGSLLGGVISDSWSRKGTYVLSQTVSGLCIFTCVLTNNKTAIIALLFVSAFFSASVKPTVNTMLYDFLPPNKRKIGQSLLYLGVNLGVSIGILFAGFMFNHYLKLFFFCDALTSFLAVSLVVFNIKDEEPRHLKVTSENPSSFMKELKSNYRITFFLGIYLVYSFIYAQNSFSLPLMLNSIFIGSGPTYFGYLMSINGITVIALTAGITYLTRKTSSLINITLGGVLYAVGFGMLGFSRHLPLFIVSTVLWTVGEILNSTNFGVYLANNSNEGMRGRYSSLMFICYSLGRAIGILSMGGYISRFGINAVWSIIMLIGSLASCMTLFMYYVQSKKEALSKTA